MVCAGLYLPKYKGYNLFTVLRVYCGVSRIVANWFVFETDIEASGKYEIKKTRGR
jgi:hypothetical protein